MGGEKRRLEERPTRGPPTAVATIRARKTRRPHFRNPERNLARWKRSARDAARERSDKDERTAAVATAREKEREGARKRAREREIETEKDGER